MGQDNGSGQTPKSQIVVEFAGPGGADIVNVSLVNVSVGQLQVLAAWARWQASKALERQMAMQQQRPGKIAVARLK